MYLRDKGVVELLRLGFILLIVLASNASAEVNLNSKPGNAMAAATDSAQASDHKDWELAINREGVRVYQRNSDVNSYHTFRAITRLQIDDYRKLFYHFDNYVFLGSWLHMISSLEDLGRRSELERYVYVTTQMPWPVSDRDACLRFSFLQNPETYEFTVLFTSVKGIKRESEDYVRAIHVNGFFNFRPLSPGRVEMTFQAEADFGGDVPAWIADMIMRDIPFFSLLSDKRVVSSPLPEPVGDHLKIPPGWGKNGPEAVN